MNKICTDIKQCKKLIELGIDVNTADMYWDYDVQKHEDYPMVMDEQFDNICIPAWSLAALLDVVSQEVSLNSFKDGDWNAMVQQNGKMIYSDADNPIDACYELILKLHEQKLL